MYKKIILCTTVAFSLLMNAGRCITQKNDWYICSPSLRENFACKQHVDQLQHTVEALDELGKQADRIWTEHAVIQTRLMHLHDIFSLLDRHFLADIIDLFLQDNDILERIAKASSKTDTGTLKILLAGGGQDSWNMYLYVWRKKEEQQIEHVQQAFYSKIIAGYIVVRTENCMSDAIGAGESYIMPAQSMHSITPGRGVVSCVFASGDREHIHLANDSHITKEELKEGLAKVQSQLRQLHITPRYLPETVDSNHSFFHPKDPILDVDDWRSAVSQNRSVKRVVQITDADKNQFLVSADVYGNILVNNQPINSEKNYLFVLCDNGMFAAPKDFHHQCTELICHSSFTDYGPVDSVGVLCFNADNSLKTIEAYSGHYQPGREHMHIALDHLRSLGVTTENVACITFQDREIHVIGSIG